MDRLIGSGGVFTAVGVLHVPEMDVAVLSLSCAEQEKMIESAADYRACGASWEVVASHFEMPLADVMSFIQANRVEYEKTLRFVRMDREYERRARHRREMRRTLKNAETISSRAAAARAIVSHAMSQERVWLKQKLEAVERAKRAARAIEKAARDALRAHRRTGF